MYQIIKILIIHINNFNKIYYDKYKKSDTAVEYIPLIIAEFDQPLLEVL